MVHVRASYLSFALAALALSGLKANAWEMSRPVGPFPKLKASQAPSAKTQPQDSLKAFLDQTSDGALDSPFGRRIFSEQRGTKSYLHCLLTASNAVL